MSDLKKFDKDGNPLNLVPTFDPKKNRNYHEQWLKNPQRFEPTDEDLKCELQLSALNEFEPLNFTVDYDQFKKEIAPWDNKWIPYLRREGISNDREALLLVGLEGDTPDVYCSAPEAKKKLGRRVDDTEFSTPTQLYHDLTCLHPLLNYFDTLGRTMLVKTNAGGWFPPHKDNPMLTRSTFRIAVFIGRSVDHESYEWDMTGVRHLIRPNQAYYIDTRKTHRTHSWNNDSIHCIINVPKTWENVIKLMTIAKYK